MVVLNTIFFIGRCSWIHDKGEQLKSEGLNLNIQGRYKDLELCGSEDVIAKSVPNLFEDLNEEKKECVSCLEVASNGALVHIWNCPRVSFDGKRYECCLCGAMYKSDRHDTRHIMEYCSRLKSEIERLHKMECENCNKTFCHKSYYKTFGENPIEISMYKL